MPTSAYEKVGLRSSKKKAVRNSFHSVILGGELDGRRGLVNAPSHSSAHALQADS